MPICLLENVFISLQRKKRLCLPQVDADKMLATPKLVIDKGKPCTTFHLDLVKNKRYRLYLSPADSIDCPKEYLLDIKK